MTCYCKNICNLAVRGAGKLTNNMTSGILEKPFSTRVVVLLTAAAAFSALLKFMIACGDVGVMDAVVEFVCNRIAGCSNDGAMFAKGVIEKRSDASLICCIFDAKMCDR
ncbi:E3 ubiquitin-protein ligase [Dirofilaria immitis]